ncbi:hypothetical protein QR77_04255 [Streptomyces sp. 150FB]|nr:hypothetical protein QR77_04255 [Streptomyces sp. 150FB]
MNTVLHERYTSSDTRYCTAIFGILEPGSGQVGVHLASGGHPSALIQRADGTAARAQLFPGDTLLLHTDGLTEARTGPERELYGEDALRAFTATQRPAGPQALITALTDLIAGFGDDTALLALGVPAPLPVSVPTPASET